MDGTTLCLPIHQLMDIWVVSSLATVNNSFLYICVQILYGHSGFPFFEVYM